MSEDTPLLRFAGDLRRLREKAGSPPYRELGRRANYSAAALSEALAGRRLPSLTVTVAFVRACEGDIDDWTARWRELAAAAPGDEETPSPYVGLAAYQVGDAERFFGREAVTGTLLALVEERPFVGVFGASGSGKSSLLRAGLAAACGRTALVLTPGGDPVRELAAAVAGLLDEPVTRIHDELAADPQALRGWLARAGTDLLLVVDQFEEAFTLCSPRDQRWLVRALTSAAGRRVRVVVGVRADFYGHCGRHPELVTALHRAQLLVGPMSAEELRRAVTEPAARVGASLETALVARLISDVTGQPAALPLVSHVLAETWRRRRGLVLSLAGYEDAGGVEHALARTADRTYEQLSEVERSAARLLFLRLIAPGEGTEDTKRRIRRDEVDAPAALLDTLAAARLISLDRDGVELVHEALLRAWPRLAGWIAEDRDALRVHRRLAEAAEVWRTHGHDPDLLYRGAHLEQAERVRDRLNPGEREFLDAGRAAERARAAGQRRSTRRLRRLVAVLAALAVLLAGASAAAAGAQRSASHQRNEALSLRASDAATNLLRTRPRDAQALALAAYRLAPTTEARGVVLLADAAVHAATLGDGYMSPPGRFAITTALPDSPGQRIWLPTGQEGWRRAGTLPAGEITYFVSADERRLLSWDSLDTFTMWDVADADHPREVAARAGLPMVRSIDGAGRLAIGADGDDAVVVWDVVTGAVRRLPTQGLADVAPLHDGTGLVVARRDGDRFAVELWSLDGRPVATLLHSPEEPGLHIGPTGLVTVIGTRTGDMAVLDIANPGAPRTRVRAGGVGYPVSIAFDPLGRAMVAAHSDTVTLWDLASGAVRLTVRVPGLDLHSPRLPSADGPIDLIEMRTGKLWRLGTDFAAVVRDICAGPVAVDWDRYFPRVPAPPLCP